MGGPTHRVFVAGATGAIGRRLVPLLIENGHQVTGTTSRREHLAAIGALGAEGVVMDGLDARSVMDAVTQARPEVVVHQMTALASMKSLKHFDREFALTNRLRTEGTRYLLDAAQAVGARKFIAQSYAGWPNRREGNRIKSEEDPLDPNPPRSVSETLDAIRELEAMVVQASGIALRYGSLYGPGTSLARDGDVVKLIAARKFPVVGNGAGIWSFIHVDDAARATQLAIESGTSGIFNITDDEPAEVSVWLPELARIMGAKPPRTIPVWLGRLFVGDAGVSMMTQTRGSSNAKAKRELGWSLRYPSWREGFRNGL